MARSDLWEIHFFDFKKLRAQIVGTLQARRSHRSCVSQLYPCQRAPWRHERFLPNQRAERIRTAELAPVFVFLASHLATYVTEEVYGVTGGQMPI